jgi:hypothetical protein
MKAFATGGASNDNEAGFFVDIVMHKFVVQSRGAVTFARTNQINNSHSNGQLKHSELPMQFEHEFLNNVWFEAS